MAIRGPAPSPLGPFSPMVDIPLRNGKIAVPGEVCQDLRIHMSRPPGQAGGRSLYSVNGSAQFDQVWSESDGQAIPKFMDSWSHVKVRISTCGRTIRTPFRSSERRRSAAAPKISCRANFDHLSEPHT